MGKGMTIGGMVVAMLVFLLFTLDLAVGFPFSRANWIMDLTALLAALGLAFLSWSTLRDFE